MDFINSLDYKILYFIQDHIRTPLLDKIFSTFSSLGNNAFIYILIIFLFVINKKTRKTGFMLMISFILSIALGEFILKNIFQRQRPFVNTNILLAISKPSSWSFPSGHTAQAFAIAGVLAYKYKKYSWIFIFLALLMGFSRIYLFVHYPSDILCGIILGLICSYISIKTTDKLKLSQF